MDHRVPSTTRQPKAISSRKGPQASLFHNPSAFVQIVGNFLREHFKTHTSVETSPFAWLQMWARDRIACGAEWSQARCHVIRACFLMFPGQSFWDGSIKDRIIGLIAT